HAGAVPSKSVARLEAGWSIRRRQHAYLSRQDCVSGPLETCRRRSSTAIAHCSSPSLSTTKMGTTELSKTCLSDLYGSHDVTPADPAGVSMALGDRSHLWSRGPLPGHRSASGADGTRGPHYGQFRRLHLRSATARTSSLPSGQQP